MAAGGLASLLQNRKFFQGNDPLMPWALTSMLDFSRLALAWPIAIPLLLGFAGIYWLLPRGKFVSSLIGSCLVSLALLSGGWLLMWGKAWTPEMVLFFAFSGIAIVSGSLLITQRNPVRAALSFALVVLSTCGLFLLLAAPFLMAATIIVYTGAIVVTFLFVIMLAQQEGPSDADHRSREPEFSCITGFVLLGSILFLLQLTYDTRATDRLLSRVHQALDFIDGLLEQKPAQQRRQPSLQKIKEDLENWQLPAMFEEFNAEVKRQREFPEFTAIDGKIMNAESSWAALVGELDRSIKAATSGDSPNDVEEVRKPLEEMRNSLRDLEEIGIQFRDSYGRLEISPEKERGLSPFSKPELYPYIADSTDFKPGQAPLPKENVASLGRSLFTDYLLPVELAGTLLLVATIGAIAIAGRRVEGLR